MGAPLKPPTLAIEATAGWLQHVKEECRPAAAGGQEAFPADAELAKRCVAGDEAAQRTFVDRYTPLVFSVCRRKGLPPDVAEDVTQEALADAFRALRSYRGEARLSSWLFTVACRHVASHFRNRARSAESLAVEGLDALRQEPADACWETRFADDERATRAKRAVEALDEPARAIVLAYYLGEMSVREIADEIGLPEGTVKSHLHRGRIAARRRLEGR
jgi:RNA polymerase sigma-70 factor, ECF subfamily